MMLFFINYKARLLYRTQGNCLPGNWKGGGFSMNNGKLIWKQEILFISFRFSCRQGPCLSTLLQEAGPGSDEKKLFNNNPRPLLCLPLHCFPFLFLPINFCLISNETGQKVIITADPTRVKNVIIKLGRGRPSASMTSHTTEEGNGNPVLIIRWWSIHKKNFQSIWNCGFYNFNIPNLKIKSYSQLSLN